MPDSCEADQDHPLVDIQSGQDQDLVILRLTIIDQDLVDSLADQIHDLVDSSASQDPSLVTSYAD